ncbi:hypothetical protein COV82_02580 [Candidatus Peregrinibacteria bacterium CG11_big_fil_rev_8_21_14_0_20_46_8]|nr:MAG: hypothetical protein COV82_02580 [Candidatus Peregrinibacteria bacterium CG11_big_fil_rev_8_21_14_0_20_46_8]
MRRGFTLLELVIVMAVIMIIAVIGVGAFTTSRQNIQITLAHEETLAALHEIRNDVRRTSECAVVEFTAGSGVRITRMPYNGEAKNCDSANGGFVPLVHYEGIHILEIRSGQSTLENVSITFIPPHGDMDFSNGASEIEISLALRKKPIFSRGIILDAETGRIEG